MQEWELGKVQGNLDRFSRMDWNERRSVKGGPPEGNLIVGEAEDVCRD